MIKNDECLDDLQNGLFIIQKQNGFKFGIDAVLLSDFAKDISSKKTLDLCTGTGIVPLLLSAKTKTPEIHGLEIQEDIAEMAQRSVDYNKLNDRVCIKCGDLKDSCEIYGKGVFDKITCNPPYMKCGSGNQNDTDTKSVSRHEVMCTLDDVIKSVSELIRPKGRFYMVHRPSRIADIMCAMRKYRIEPKKIRFVHPSAGKAPNMVLVEGISDGGDELKILDPLYVYNADGAYTKEIDRIYGRISEENI
ncbi:MAG: tRNA1(Val) (adenine(37)-N6)-methyltransferase [Clostridia bacterium]|nr:tRNA1(Val) (adenine(37)-N6)-methyltransferase [Clostridia bacterium]